MKETLVPYYFAYGSNVNPKRMKERGAAFRSLRKARLKGYRLVFNKRTKKGAAANVVEAPGEAVEGVLYELENPEEAIRNLDEREGYYGPGEDNHYERLVMKVETPDGKLYDAVVYVAKNPEHLAEGLKPSEDYLAHLLIACELGLLSEGYCKNLKALYREFFGKEPPVFIPYGG